MVLRKIMRDATGATEDGYRETQDYIQRGQQEKNFKEIQV